MIQGFGLLLGFQLAGETLAHLLHVPIPGSVIGLLLLFGWLQMVAVTGRGGAETLDRSELAQVATPLLRNLGILFVPAGVGVLQYFELFLRHGPRVLFVLMVSTLLTMTVTALVFAGSQSLAAGFGLRWRAYRAGSRANSPSLQRQPEESSAILQNGGA